MGNKATSFYIKKNGTNRRLLRFEENQSGTVVINIYSGSQDGIPPNHGFIKTRKYSVHPSVNVLDKNAIHYTVSYSDGANEEHYNWTTAIKSQNGFASIFCELFPKLDSSLYDMKNKHYVSSRSLGNFNLDEKCLMIYLFVAAKDVETRTH